MKNLQSIPKSQIFTREQLKAIRGGDDYGYGDSCCCAHTDSHDFECGLTKAEAQSRASSIGGKWCCESCSSAGAPAPCEK
jgi:hypothetical protein